jgi:predicted lipoprotein
MNMKEQRSPMAQPKSVPYRAPSRRPGFWLRLIFILLGLTVVVVAFASTKVVSIAAADAASGDKFSPAKFAEDNYSSKIVPKIESEAIDLTTLLAKLAGGADKSTLGHSSGKDSAYAFPITVTAVAGDPTPPVIQLAVDGLPDKTVVVMQIGPAVNGTAIRDVSGTISFNQFTNQLEYQAVATELNNQVKESVLSKLDAQSLKGKTLKITGAFLLGSNPQFISIVPIKVEVLP